MQPLDTSRGHSTKNQPQEHCTHARNISSNTLHTLYCELLTETVDSSTVRQFRQFHQAQRQTSPVPPWPDAALHLLLIQCAARSLGHFWVSVALWPDHAGDIRGNSTARGG